MNAGSVNPAMMQRPIAPTQTIALALDKLNLEVTTVQKVSKAQLTGQLAQLQNQVANLNAQISKIQESLDLFPQPDITAKDVPQG